MRSEKRAFAGLAVEEAALVLAVTATDGEVAGVTAAVVRAVGVVSAEAAEVVGHGGRRRRAKAHWISP